MGSDPERFKKGLSLVIGFGKHKEKTLKEICKEDPEYVVWLVQDDNGPRLNVKQAVIDEAKKYGASFF